MKKEGIAIKHLLSPLHVGNLQLKNRLIFPPMASAKSLEDGMVGDEILEYYDKITKGGYFSLVIVEHSYIAKQGIAKKGQLSIADNSTIKGLKRIADLIHLNGSKAIVQINHAGSVASTDNTGMEPVGPSPVINPFRKENPLPRELTLTEIKDIVKGFRDAAVRTKEAGFDGVEIHSAHGYLLNQFYSPLTNKRSDEYGKDVYGRIKLHLEIIRAVRDAVGPTFPILLRLGACDYMEGGATIADSIIAAKEFEKAGVDILDISGGLCGYIIPGGNNDEEGYFWPVTKAIKEAISIPVILTGGIKTAAAADTLLAEGKADLIGVGRAILKDFKWAEKELS